MVSNGLHLGLPKNDADPNSITYTAYKFKELNQTHSWCFSILCYHFWTYSKELSAVSNETSWWELILMWLSFLCTRGDEELSRAIIYGGLSSEGVPIYSTISKLSEVIRFSTLYKESNFLSYDDLLYYFNECWSLPHKFASTSRSVFRIQSGKPS